MNRPDPSAHNDAGRQDEVLEQPTLAPVPEDAATLLPPPDGTQSDSEQDQRYSETWTRAEDLEGESLGNYHRLARVGSWRFGSLFEAEHAQLHRRVRLITLDRPWSDRSDLRSWFMARTRSIAKIHFPSVASAVLECVETEGIVFIVLPAPGRRTCNVLRDRARRAVLGGTVEPLSHAFSLLLEGLHYCHQQGMVHGAIDVDHILIGDSTDEVQWDPFATGIPESQYIDEHGQERIDRIQIQQEDYRRLARAYLATLTGQRVDELPKTLRPRWIRNRLPFAPPKLVQLLANLSTSKRRSPRIDADLRRLREMRHEPLSRAMWSERVVNMFYEAAFVFVASLATLPIVLIIAPELSLNRGDAIFLSLLLIYFVLFSALQIVTRQSLLRRGFGYLLIDRDGGFPTRKQWFVRSALRLGVLFGLAGILTAIWVGLVPHTPVADQGDIAAIESSWSLSFLVFLVPAALLVYATSFLFRNQLLHDWLSRTLWVHFRSQRDGPILKLAPHATMQRPSIAIASHFLSSQQPMDWMDGIAIEKTLGSGGMGIVYQGTDETLHRQVAVKLIAVDSSSHDEIIQRFRREAQLGSVLNHTNIAKVYRVGLWNLRPYIAMEFVDGETFQQIVREYGPVPIEQAWDWIRQAAIGLQEASHQGIIHRDIKPANLMVTRDGVVKVMDFGISKSIDDQEDPPRDADSATCDSSTPSECSLTRAGAILGTPQYMSPEQARCEKLDHASDIYSLGLTLYFLIAGKPAFESNVEYDLIMRQCTDSPPPLPKSKLNARQRNLLDRMLSKPKEGRFQNYGDLIAAIDQSKPAEMRLPSTSRRFAAMLADGVLLFLVILLVQFLHGALIAVTEVVGIPPPMRFFQAMEILLATACYFVPPMVWLGGSPGHRLLGLKVIRADGSAVGWREAMLRFLGKFPCVVFALLCNLPFLSPISAWIREAWTDDWVMGASIAVWLVSYAVVNINDSTHRKAIHDYLAGTRVVYTKTGFFEWDWSSLLRMKRPTVS